MGLEDTALPALGGIGEGLQSFADTYLKTKQANIANQTAKAGLLNAGYQADEDGNLVPTDEKKNELAIKKAQTQYQLSSMDPNSDQSVGSRKQWQNILKNYQPGAEKLISHSMSQYEIENNVMPKIKMMNDMNLENQLKGLDIANKKKQFQAPDENAASAATAYSQATAANNAVNKLEDIGFDPGSVGSGFQGMLGTKFAQSPEYKQNQAAENQFVGAYTAWRKQRGENPESADVIKGRYFSQPGDDTGSKDLKKQARADFLSTLKAQAGTYAQNPQPTTGLIGNKSNNNVPVNKIQSWAKDHGLSDDMANTILNLRRAGKTAIQNKTPQGGS
jgi:hypothetical protein